MRTFSILFLMVLQVALLRGQVFDFQYGGPDTLFVDADCAVALDWGHPDQPVVQSLIGAQIDSFFIYSIENDYELSELVEAGQSIEVTYRVVDDQGNAANFSFVIYIDDAIPPVVVQGPTGQTHDCEEADIESFLLDWYNARAGLLAEDNCNVTVAADKSYEETLLAFNQSVNQECGETRSVTLHFTVADEAGNQLPEFSATFRTIDDTDPVFTTLPSPLVTSCSEDVDQLLEDWIDNKGGAIATDACSDELEWTFLWNDNDGNSGYEVIGNKPYDLQVIRGLCNFNVNLNFFVTDACDNQKAIFTTISIVDDNVPAFTLLPADTLVLCDQLPELPLVEAIDPCKGDLIVLFEETSTQGNEPIYTNYYNYSINQVWSSGDGCGHEISHSRTIQVRDTVGPDFTVPPTVTVECTQLDQINITGVPQNLFDNCSSFLDVRFVDEPQGSGCSYTVNRVWSIKDASGNITTQVQQINVIDTTGPELTMLPQDLMVSCDSEDASASYFFDWVDHLGYASFSDACNIPNGFAAIPGSYIIDDPASYPGQVPDADFLYECSAGPDFQMSAVAVDFVFYDNCGNAVRYTRHFNVLDQEAPQFVNCPPDTLIVLPVDVCQADYTLPVVLATDNCTGIPLTRSLHQAFTIHSAVPGDTQIPVDTTLLSIGPLDPGEQEIESLLDLRFSFFNIDANDTYEYFVIRGEDGTILDTTPKIDMECGDFEMQLKDLVELNQLIDWLEDGFLEIWLEPKIIASGGVFSINDICGHSYVEVDLELNSVAFSQMAYQYRFGEESFRAYSPDIAVDTTLSGGQHILQYKALDCVGNEAVCTQVIEIKDQQAPEIACPSDVSLILPQDSCSQSFRLPEVFGFADNCSEQWHRAIRAPLDPEDDLILFSLDGESGQYIADNRSFSFAIDLPDLIREPKLKLFVQGDFDEVGEYFELLDEGGQLIGQTPPGACDSVSMLEIVLNEEDFLNWISDGELSIVARSAISPNAINPCDPDALSDIQATDGISRFHLELEYQSLDVQYRLFGATEAGPAPLSNTGAGTMVGLNGGHTQVQYYLMDQGSNTDTCSFSVQLEDRQAPVANCKGALAIFLHPSGVENYLLTPGELDEGSFDNCGIDSMAVVPAEFDCTQAGSTVEVMFYVWDMAGNVDSCQASIKVETQKLNPSYQAGVCAFDTLKLFSNLPPAPPGIYSILWSKNNNGFSSNEENPIRPNADESYSGTYTLEVTGLNGCYSSGFVDVFIENLTMPIIKETQDTLCEGESLLLETNTYSGNVVYRWYSGFYPDGILMDSTFVPSLLVEPNIGANNYYLIVESRNCISLPSQNTRIVVLETPLATVNNPFINLCEGEDLLLGTGVTGPGYSYYWWGPDSWESFVQNPAVIENVKLKNQGTYRLAVFNGICSDTAVVQVLVNKRPVTPVILSDELYCEDEPMVLTVANLTNASTYSWYLNGDLFTVQNTNSLLIPGAQSIFSGDWQVVAKSGSCYSDTSNVKTIQVELKFEVMASNSGPVCAGDSVHLYAPDIPGASYLWVGPEDDSTFLQSPVLPAKKGLYSLEVVTSGGCLLSSSTYVDVVERPRITALSNDAPSCIDGTECISFKPSVFPNLTGYQYHWTGPDGFQSQDSIAMLCFPGTANNGIYQLVVSNGFCASEIAQSQVEMFPIPETPVLAGDLTLCEHDTLFLIDQQSTLEELLYFWKTPGGNVYQTSDAELIIPNVGTGSGGYYSVRSFSGTCYSEPSDSVLVEVLKQPNQPVIWTEDSYCEGDPISLFTHFVQGAQYWWEGPNGFNASVQNPVIFPSDTLAEGVYRCRISVDGCYSDISEGLVIEIRRKPDRPKLIASVSALCVDEPGARVSLCLQNQVSGVTYSWYHNETGEVLSSGAEDCYFLDAFGAFSEGVNGFYVLAEQGNCLSDPSSLVSVRLDRIPDQKAWAGEDVEVCDDDQLFLSADPYPGGLWKPANPVLQVKNPSEPGSQISNLNEGDNLFVWSLSHGECVDFDRDSVVITITRTPVAMDDYYTTSYDIPIELEPNANDQYANDCQIEIDPQLLQFGTLEANGPVSFWFDPSADFIGKIRVPYKLIHEICTEKQSEAFIEIEVGDAAACFGVNVITPNGDGVNDLLVFPCLESGLYPKNKLIVFNQWGDEVYSASPYLNDWSGTYKSKDLPVGTYYYLLDLRNGAPKTRDFFVIER